MGKEHLHHSKEPNTLIASPSALWWDPVVCLGTLGGEWILFFFPSGKDF